MLPRSEELEEYLLQLTPIADIAALHNCSEMELREAIADPDHELYRAARAAKAKLGSMLREQLIDKSAAGDPTAGHMLQRQLNRIYNDI